MFKSVEYVGFEDLPDLRQRAEYATGVLAGEIGDDFHRDVAVGWRPAPAGGLELSLRFTLPIGGGVGSGTGAATELDPANEPDLRSRLRRAWIAALDHFFEYRRRVWDEVLSEPVGV